MLNRRQGRLQSSTRRAFRHRGHTLTLEETMIPLALDLQSTLFCKRYQKKAKVKNSNKVWNEPISRGSSSRAPSNKKWRISKRRGGNVATHDIEIRSLTVWLSLWWEHSPCGIQRIRRRKTGKQLVNDNYRTVETPLCADHGWYFVLS